MGLPLITLLTDQTQSDELFRHWVNALLDSAIEVSAGWIIEGTGVVFTNYGHGARGEIENEVALGVDETGKNQAVKIVMPDVIQQDRGKLTAIGKGDDGRHYLLRQGWLQKNALSDSIRTNFADLTGLSSVPVSTTTGGSSRDWFVVADLSQSGSVVVAATAAFANACAIARIRAGTKDLIVDEAVGYTLGLDEKGRTKKVTTGGGTREVIELQGYVWEELKKLVGDPLSKPQSRGYSVDAMIEAANMLIEIKTGISAQDIYGAVGQLALYPSLISLPVGLDQILLIPRHPPLGQAMGSALAAKNIAIYTYSVGAIGGSPEITFSKPFLERCQSRPM
jgi:hypothetical protein